jgi:hypothetical protein
MNRKSIRGIYSKPMDATARPIIENAKLPAMTDAVAPMQQAPARDANSRLMDDAQPPAVDASKPTMGAFVVDQPGPIRVIPRVLPDQEPRLTRATPDTSYVVLRMRVQDGKLAVVGSKRVDGPLLAEEEVVQDGLTYEASIDDKRLSLGSVPDFGEQRSYPRPGTTEHYVTVLPSFDFNLRVPSDKISLQDLPRLKISLYRFKVPVPNLKLGPQPLRAQLDQEVRVVAELNGIQVAKLPPNVQEVVQRAFTR